MSVQVIASPPTLPAEFLVTPMIGQTRVNGVAMHIMTVSSFMSPERACARVALSWRATAQAAVGNCRRVGSWLLIDRREGGRGQVVQLRAAAGTATGYYSERELNQRPAGLPSPRLPVPTGAQLVNVVQSSVSGSEMKQFTFRYSLASRELARRLWRRATARGWASIANPSASDTLFDFEHAGIQVRAVLLGAAGGSNLVVTEIDAAAPLP